MRPSMSALSGGLLGIVLFACSGCTPQDQYAWVYIDNTGSSEITVQVDSVEVAKVPPHIIEKIKVVTGAHRFMVQAGGSIVYNGMHTIAPSRSFLSMQRYVFNPDRRGRYATCQVHYGTPWTEKLKLVSLSQPGNEEAFIRSEYSSLVKDLAAMPSDPWIEVPSGAIVFEPAPERVVARRSTTRLVMNRISEKDYHYLRSALTRSSPNEDDLEDLWMFAELNFF